MTIGTSEEGTQAQEAADVAGYLAVHVEDRGWVTRPPSPWRRYGARTLDVMVSGATGFMILGFIWYSVAPLSADRFFTTFDAPGGKLLDFALTVMMAGFLNALMIAFTGYTIGKAVFGIQVLNIDRSLLGFASALKRELLVWAKGLGLGIPLISLFTLIAGYRRLSEKGEASWDEGASVVLYRPAGSTQTVLNVLGVGLIIGSRLVLQML